VLPISLPVVEVYGCRACIAVCVAVCVAEGKKFMQPISLPLAEELCTNKRRFQVGLPAVAIVKLQNIRLFVKIQGSFAEV